MIFAYSHVAFYYVHIVLCCKNPINYYCFLCVFQRAVHKEKQITENVIAANAKLLHECEILHNRLEECSVNFLIEEEDKLIVDTSSPSDAIDLLTTSDNRIGLLLAEVTSHILFITLKMRKCFHLESFFHMMVALEFGVLKYSVWTISFKTRCFSPQNIVPCMLSYQT
jgi:hypothetical protein